VEPKYKKPKRRFKNQMIFIFYAKQFLGLFLSWSFKKPTTDLKKRSIIVF